MQKHLFRYFSSTGPNVFLNVSITFIDKTDPEIPRKREDLWGETLKRMVPYGLDIEESAWLIMRVANFCNIIFSIGN